jgi:hypothetical protein
MPKVAITHAKNSLLTVEFDNLYSLISNHDTSNHLGGNNT